MSANSQRTLKWRANNRARFEEYQRAYRVTNRAKINAQQRALREKNPKQYKEYHLRRAYGLTVEQFEYLKVQQSGRCAVCRCVPDKLHVDHDHDTGNVRGLLCGNCNRALGQLKEDPLRIRALAEYAERFAWLKQ